MKKSFKKVLAFLLVAVIVSLSTVATIYVVSAADLTYAGSSFTDFSLYTVKATGNNVTQGNARNNAGTFSVASDSTVAGGKYLKFVRNTKTDTAAQSASGYEFLINPKGSYAADGALMLEPEHTYQLKMRYKTSGFDANQIYQFRLYNTADKKYTISAVDSSTRVTVFASTGNKDDWTVVTYKFAAPDAPTNGYTLAGCFVPVPTTDNTSEKISYNVKGWEVDVDYIEILADDKANRIDFSSYDADLTANKQAVRTEAGVFTLENDPNAQGKKYLKYKRSEDTAVVNGTDPALYTFMLNKYGSMSDTTALKFESKKDYSVVAKYRILNSDQDAANQNWELRLYYTEPGKYTTEFISAASGVTVVKQKGNTDGFVTRTYNFTAPERTVDNVSIATCFVPVTDGVIKQLPSYEVDIDYIEFGEPVEGTSDDELKDSIHTVDFNKYVITTDPSERVKASVRTEAGVFSIGKSAECSNNSYLKFVRSNVSSDHVAHYMFLINETGSYKKEGSFALQPETAYQMTIRYRITNYPEGVSYQFRLLHSKGFGLCNWDGGTAGSTVVFASNGDTDGFITQTYYFTSPIAPSENYGLIGCFIPVSTASAVSNASKPDAYNYEIDIDYIDFALDPEGDSRLPSFINYPLPEKYLKTLPEEDESILKFKGKDSSFWSDQFNNGAVKALSYGWSRLEKDDPNYQQFQAINTVTMNDEETFYKTPNRDNFMASFLAGIIDISDYINTGYLRFWIKVPKDMTVTVSLEDQSYVQTKVLTELKKTTENNGYYEVAIPLRKFYDVAVSEGKKWNHSKIYMVVITPTEHTPEGFIGNGESIVLTPWQIWTKEPQETHIDINRYFYAQLGSEMKIRDTNEVMSSGTVLRAFRNTEEEPQLSKLVSNSFKNGKLLEYWSIYALSASNVDSRIEDPYEPIDLMIPYEGIFTNRNLVVGVVSEKGDVTILPKTLEDGYLVLKTEDLGNFIFFTADGVVKNVSAKGAYMPMGSAQIKNLSVNTQTEDLNEYTGVERSPGTGDKVFKVAVIWFAALALSALGVFFLLYGRLNMKSKAISVICIMLCLALMTSLLSACGGKDTPAKKKKKKVVIVQKRPTSSDVSEDDSEDESDDDYEYDYEEYEEEEEEDYEEEETEESAEIMELRIINEHPGIPGYDAEYEFRALVGTELDMTRISEDEFTLSCSVPEIKIDGTKVTVPASFKDNTDMGGVKIYATYNKNKNVIGCFPLTFTKWTLTFDDEFDGKTLDRTKWTDDSKYVYHTYYDLKDGTINIHTDVVTYLENGHLVLPIIKNTENKTYMMFDGSKQVPVTPGYLSGGLRTDYTFGQSCGVFSVKMKGPGGETMPGGVNNAFWLMPTNGTWGTDYLFNYVAGDNNGTSCGEIDIVERSVGWGKGEWQNTHHLWDTLTGVKTGTSGDAVKLYNKELLNGDYMEYTLAWTRDALYMYANGKLVRSTVNVMPTGKTAYMILSNNLNSMNPEEPAWTGYAREEDLDDLTVYVDWVRVYDVK